MDRITLINAINTEIDAKLAALHQETPRVATRRVARGDYTADLHAAFALTTPEDHWLVFSETGGFVPNGYKFAGTTDHLSVKVNLTDNTFTVWAVRCRADKRPYGSGDTRRARVQREGRSRDVLASW